MSDMRIGGLASRMDIDKLVNDLMRAERQPLNKMEQDKTWMTWQRDSYREVNKQLFDLDQGLLDMKLQRTYAAKTATSPTSAVSAEATPSAGNGNYNIQVTQLATAAFNVSEQKLTDPNDSKIDPDQALSSQFGKFATHASEGSFTIKMFNENGEEISESFEVDYSKSLSEILKEISDSDLGVRAFYDSSADKVMIERTRTGEFNPAGPEFEFSGENVAFLTDSLGIKAANEKGGKDAVFTYNGELEISSHENHYQLNGVTFTFNEIMDSPVNVNVSNNIDGAIDKITKFVDQYNKMMEDFNDRLIEKRYRDFPPLTEQQKEDMEEREIELWEEKARSGMLKSNSTLQGAVYQLRNDWYSSVETGGSFNQLAQIGIETSPNYLDGGKLIITESKLREALREDSDAVHKLFAGNKETGEEGIAQKLERTIGNTMESIENKAGKSTSMDSTYLLGRQIKDVDDRMDDFQARLNETEDRYWREFGAMEKFIQQMNSQSAFIMQNFS
ncbi:flagellar hook-associated protein 2 [Halobacillus mangrovi]|uniref:Flagellar hook-associated protein 2 n=1 Tax=Halobacillus mangrovi TaxID=402384 RepID=A0A1W5ZTE0_9BACI|nr:flagellar hook-associated protein 2 [Halobacillus mangrovi]ARI76521.1 flagellar capping protein [Halobacillus mangrovi]